MGEQLLRRLNFQRQVFEDRANSAATIPNLALLTLALLTASAAGKLAAASLTDLTADETYATVIGRSFALSYFDHPPLHQWIVHAFTACFGEGWQVRLPFLFMAEALNVPLYGLTGRLFGRNAALWALFGFNTTAYFTVWPDGLIMPDVPLFLFLTAGVWAVAEILFGPPSGKSRLWALWLAAGVAFGFAGLAKYSAIFVPVGLFGFLCGSSAHRHWLWRPQPYLAAALALAIFSPVLIWNAQNNWVSFAFQSGRASGGPSLGLAAFKHFAEALGAQVALLSPWACLPLVLALKDAVKSRDAGSAQRFLLWLVAVPLLLFSSLPFVGRTSIPHWFNSAWLFAFPLLGLWLERQSAKWLRSWAAPSAALTALTFVLFTAYLIEGPLWRAANASPRELALQSFDLQTLGTGSSRPSFVVVDVWSIGGKVGAILGPEVPVCTFSQDPREFAFLCSSKALLGQDALIVLPKERTEKDLAKLAPYFEHLDARPSQEIEVASDWGLRRTVTLTRAHVLLRPYSSPYGNDAKPAS